MTMTRNEVQTAVAVLLGDLLLDSKVVTGSTTGVADPAITFPTTEQLVGRDIYFLSSRVGSVNAISRLVSSNAVGSIYFTPALAAAPTAGDSYHVYNNYKAQDYKQAIDEADRRAAEIFLIDASATLSLTGTQYEYAVPSGFRFIHSMKIVPSGSSDYTFDAEDIAHNAWDVKINPAGSRVIAFDHKRIYMPDYDKEMLAVYGQRRPRSLSVGTTICEYPESYIINKAAAILSLRRVGISEADVARFGLFNTEAFNLEKRLFRYRKANSREVS